MTTLRSPVGLIAGSGSYPLQFAKSAKEQGVRLIVAAHRDEADPEIERYADVIRWVKIGQLGKILALFKKEQVQQAAFAGGISRVRIFSGMLQPDLKGALLIARVGSMQDDKILRGVTEELQKIGIETISASSLLKDSHPEAGCLTRVKLSEAERADARIGWEACKDIGRHEVGQTVIVKDGLVVAVEGIEGTDETIRRAGSLGAAGAVVVKLPKPQQDARLDLPTIGLKTIEVMKEAGARALVLEAHGAVLLEPQEIITAANAAGITIFVCESISDLLDNPASAAG